MPSDDPALPPNLARTIADLERRLRNVESSNRLQSSSVRGGTFQVLDDDGNEVARTGRLQSSPFAVDGFYVNSETGAGWHLYVGDNVGFALPWLDHAWFDPTDAISVTSGTFVETWRCVFELATSYVVKFRVFVDVPAATTAELRVLGPGDVQVGGDKSVVGASVAYHEFDTNAGLTLASGPISFKLQVRRTAGAGTISVYKPSPLAVGAVGFVNDPDGWV